LPESTAIAAVLPLLDPIYLNLFSRGDFSCFTLCTLRLCAKLFYRIARGGAEYAEQRRFNEASSTYQLSFPAALACG
jgi:hypothetical protein